MDERRRKGKGEIKWNWESIKEQEERKKRKGNIVDQSSMSRRNLYCQRKEAKITARRYRCRSLIVREKFLDAKRRSGGNDKKIIIIIKKDD